MKCFFEDSDTGDELTLNPDLTYEVTATYVDLDEDGHPTFTYRVKLVRHQFIAHPEDGSIEVIDLENPTGEEE